jgi:site-specific recombinase XerD
MMKNNQKLNILFRINNQKMKDVRSPIYIRVIVDGKKKEIATRHYIDPNHWDSKKQYVKSRDVDSDFINNFMMRAQLSIKVYYLESISKGVNTSAEELKNKFSGIEDTGKKKTLLEAIVYHNLRMSELVAIGKVSPNTYKRYEITKNKIVKFMNLRYRRTDLLLDELRLSFVTEFEHHLLTRDELQANTAFKYIKNLKKILNMAIQLDWIAINPFNQFKCRYKIPDRVVLSQIQLDTLIHKEIKVTRLSEVRDVFVFCCYTGFAYSEVHKFDRNALNIGMDGEYWITTHRQKTGTRESVPLLPKALEIVRKYEKHEKCVKYNRLLPVDSNQRYNGYLKELASMCGIEENITTHTARHTFATTVTLSNGVPIETVSKMLGHTKLETTQIYAKVLDGKVSDDMQALKSKLSVIKNKNTGTE